jgi:alcohol dehydrogenase
LNPVDFTFRQGKLRAILRPRLPFVLGNELAGEVIVVGGDVKRSMWVIACLPGSQGTGLAHSRSRHASTRLTLRHIPRNLDFTAATAVPLAGLTARQALRDERNASAACFSQFHLVSIERRGNF